MVGSLQHATKVVRHGRAFVYRMYSTTAQLQKIHFHARLNVESRSDLCWWPIFLADWNGLNLLWWGDIDWTPITSFKQMHQELRVVALLAGPMASLVLASRWVIHNIMVKELVSIVLSCAIWGWKLAGSKVLLNVTILVLLPLLIDTTDHLSRGNLHSFFCLHPQATCQLTPLPPPLLQILTTGGPDWTSALFRQLFSTILRMV